jgi:hypothetical protein
VRKTQPEIDDGDSFPLAIDDGDARMFFPAGQGAGDSFAVVLIRNCV